MKIVIYFLAFGFVFNSLDKVGIYPLIKLFKMDYLLVMRLMKLLKPYHTLLVKLILIIII